MLALIQRVTSASVAIEGVDVGAIGPGLLALVGVEPGDSSDQVGRMARRLLGYRVFADDQGRMNRSLAQTGGGLLLVSQFTLAADTRSGMRPGFSTAMAPPEAERIFDALVETCARMHPRGVETGRFGAHMAISLRVTSKGQVTIPRDLRELAGIELNSEVIFSVEGGKLVLAPKNGKQELEDRGRLGRFMNALDRLEGTGDQTVDAEALMSITRDR